MSLANKQAVEELRALLATIAEEDRALDRACRDQAHLETVVESAHARRDTALARVKELLKASGDYTQDDDLLLAIMTSLSVAAEQHGWDHT